VENYKNSHFTEFKIFNFSDMQLEIANQASIHFLLQCYHQGLVACNVKHLITSVVKYIVQLVAVKIWIINKELQSPKEKYHKLVGIQKTAWNKQSKGNKQNTLTPKREAMFKSVATVLRSVLSKITMLGTLRRNNDTRPEFSRLPPSPIAMTVF
jgi:hypothetical protein